MNNEEFLNLVIRLADRSSGELRKAFLGALPGARLFIKLVGLPRSVAPGQLFTVPPGSGVGTRSVRLPNGMQMVRASAAPPAAVGSDEIVVTMPGSAVLQMVMTMPDHGLIAAAEDARDSWTGLARDGVASILGRKFVE